MFDRKALNDAADRRRGHRRARRYLNLQRYVKVTLVPVEAAAQYGIAWLPRRALSGRPSDLVAVGAPEYAVVVIVHQPMERSRRPSTPRLAGARRCRPALGGHPRVRVETDRGQDSSDRCRPASTFSFAETSEVVVVVRSLL